jgi:hypothetical protein
LTNLQFCAVTAGTSPALLLRGLDAVFRGADKKHVNLINACMDCVECQTNLQQYKAFSVYMEP